MLTRKVLFHSLLAHRNVHEEFVAHGRRIGIRTELVVDLWRWRFRVLALRDGDLVAREERSRLLAHRSTSAEADPEWTTFVRRAVACHTSQRRQIRRETGPMQGLGWDDRPGGSDHRKSLLRLELALIGSLVGMFMLANLDQRPAAQGVVTPSPDAGAARASLSPRISHDAPTHIRRWQAARTGSTERGSG